MVPNVERSLGAVVIIVTDPVGRMLIIRENRIDPLWKFPGGNIEEGELPLDAAIRELHEETGLSLAGEDLRYSYTEIKDKGKENEHNLHVYRGKVLSWKGRVLKGNDGEETSIVHCYEIMRMNKFLRDHHVILNKLINRSDRGILS